MNRSAGDTPDSKIWRLGNIYRWEQQSKQLFLKKKQKKKIKTKTKK